MKYDCINGWTKSKVINHIHSTFKGKATLDGTNDGYCAYLTKDGKRCAVGLFIPDGHPAQHSKDWVGSLLESRPDLHKHMPLPPEAMMALQDIHDNLEMSSALEDQAQELTGWVEEHVV